MDSNQHISREGSSSAEAKTAIQLLGSFIGLLKSIPLYPPGHQMLLQTLDKFFTFLQHALYQQNIIPMRIFKNNVFCLDVQCAPDKLVGVQDFIEELQKRYVRQIIFKNGVTLEETEKFLGVFNLDPHEIEAKGGVDKILNSQGIKGIKVIEYYSRKLITLDQEKLLELTNSEIFTFLIEEKAAALSPETALKLYELLKDANLICALIKVAAQYILKNNPEAGNQSKLILNMLNRIKSAISAASFSEEEETREILKGTVTAFDPETLFDLVFENPEDEIIKFTDAAPHLATILKPQKAAAMITEKIVLANNSQHVVSHTKAVLNRLFVDRQAFLSFLPEFKQTLQSTIPDIDRANTVLNEVCSSFTAEFSVEDDVELSLGTISDTEKTAIADGLNTLTAVPLKGKALEKEIFDFPVQPDYVKILREIMLQETKPSLFQKILDKLIEITQGYLRSDQSTQIKEMFRFFLSSVSANSPLPEELKEKIIRSQQSLPESTLENFISEILNAAGQEEIASLLHELRLVFSEKLISVLINIYLRQENLPNQELIADFIANNYSTALIKPDSRLRTYPSTQAMRLMNLLLRLPGTSALSILWEMTYHNNVLIAQRALANLAIKNPAKAMPFLLKATGHPNHTVCIISIELLGQYENNIEVANILAAIARGERAGNDEEKTLACRQSAIVTLAKLNRAKTEEALREILGRKKFLFFPTEPKEIRVFVKEQLKQLRG